jgi:hypothetical protein
MRKIFEFATTTALVLCVTFAANAAPAPAAFPTNAVNNVSIQLTITTQGLTTTNRSGLAVQAVKISTINTKAVITAIGDSLGINFSPAAQLHVVKPLFYTTNFSTNVVGNKETITMLTIGANTNASVVILDRGIATEVPAGSFTTSETNAVISSTTTTNTDLTEAQTTYDLETFTFTSRALSFTVRGFDVETLNYYKVAGGVYVADATRALTSGSGTVTMPGLGGTVVNGVCQGQITIAFAKLE